MGTKMKLRLFVTGTVFSTVAMSGCLGDNPATPSHDADVKVSATSTDPRIQFMVEQMGIRESAIFMDIQEGTTDTTYQVFPMLNAEEQAKGILVGGFGFTKKTLDTLISKKLANVGNASYKAKSNAADIAIGNSPALGKASHTRWDYWYSGLDVKALPEVHQVRVFITVSGSARLGPNWQAAIRAAISNWNTQAKGTAVSFVETTDPNNCDVIINASLGLGPDGTATHMAFLSADPYIEPNGVSLWVNSGHEHNGVPHNQKTTAGMSLLALATNLTFVGMEGFYWNMGDLIHIPGTPYNDGNASTPGSSVLTYGTSPVSTPVLTAGDLKALRTLYPLHGVSAITTHGAWRTVGYESYPVGFWGARRVQVAGDTVFINTMAQGLVRKIGLTGTAQYLWTSSGSNSAENFIYSKGNIALRTNSGLLYTMMPGGGWVLQVSGVASDDFRLDGNRLTYVVVNPNNGNRDLYSKYITATGSSATILDWLGTPYVSDFRTRNGLLVIADNGDVWAMQNYEGWVHTHSYGSGYAQRLYLSDNLVVMYYYTPGNWSGSYAVRAGGHYGGWWSYYTDPVYSPDDIDVCGNKVAFLQETAWLRVVDYGTWTVHEHYQLPNPAFAKVQLSGANCDFVATVDHSGILRTKYGIDLNTDYYQNYSGVIGLPQKL
jgi:hypothetical protein